MEKSWLRNILLRPFIRFSFEQKDNVSPCLFWNILGGNFPTWWWVKICVISWKDAKSTQWQYRSETKKPSISCLISNTLFLGRNIILAKFVLYTSLGSKSTLKGSLHKRIFCVNLKRENFLCAKLLNLWSVLCSCNCLAPKDRVTLEMHCWGHSSETENAMAVTDMNLLLTWLHMLLVRKGVLPQRTCSWDKEKENARGQMLADKTQMDKEMQVQLATSFTGK